MKLLTFATATVALALTACGQQKAADSEANAPAATEQAQSAETYSGTGKVTAIAGDQITIDHGPIEAIGWSAMTMSFSAPPEIAAGVEVGSEVSFAFRQDGSIYVLTRLEKR
jgi:Cu(I)/Ag(I) efflux system protein CusF